MKKPLVVISLLIACLLASCSNDTRHGNGGNIYDAMLNENSKSQAQESNPSSSAIDPYEGKTIPTYTQIDLDMSVMSQPEISYTFSDMCSNPDNYAEQVVKLTGRFIVVESAVDGFGFPSIYLLDDGATVTCGCNALEIVLYDFNDLCPMSGGDGYPSVNQRVTFVGRFNKYYEGEYRYVHLYDAVWLDRLVG